MACSMNEERLIEFQSGDLRGPDRDALEAHLVGCRDCLKEYFLLKRDFESAHAVDHRPSSLVRRRVEVDFHVFAERSAAGQRWMVANRRKVYLASMLAAAALLLVILFQGSRSVEPKAGPADSSVRTLEDAVDSGRNSPKFINIL